MAEYDELPEPDLPPRAGLPTFLGMRPQDFVAMLGGILGNVPLGRGPVSSTIRPFGAMFPLAQGMENSDQRARQQASVSALQSQYGGETDLPEFKTALLLANQGDFKGAMSLLGKGISDRNTRQREDRTSLRSGQAAEQWGLAQAPVRELGRPALPESPQVGQEDDYVPATPGTPDVDRAPEMSEIYDRLKAIADPTIRGLAFKAGDTAIAQRNLEDSKLRPKTEVKDGRLIQYDPRRGTATPGEELPETTAQKATRLLREARTTKEEALTARANRDPNAPLGSKLNPHVSYQTFEDAQGVRKRHQVESWVEADPTAPDGVKHQSRLVPLGRSPFKPPAPPRPPGVSDYTTTTTRDVAPKPITNFDTITALNAALPDNVKKAVPGFQVPSTPTVTLPDGTQRSRQQVVDRAIEKITEHYKQMDPPLDVVVRLLPTGQFTIVRALESGRSLGSTTTRTRGTVPRAAAPTPADTEDDGDE